MGTNPMTPKLDMGRQLSSICLSVYHSTTLPLPDYHYHSITVSRGLLHIRRQSTV